MITWSFIKRRTNLLKRHFLDGHDGQSRPVTKERDWPMHVKHVASRSCWFCPVIDIALRPHLSKFSPLAYLSQTVAIGVGCCVGYFHSNRYVCYVVTRAASYDRFCGIFTWLRYHNIEGIGPVLYNEVTWTPRRLKSSVLRLFGQQIVSANSKETSNVCISGPWR